MGSEYIEVKSNNSKTYKQVLDSLCTLIDTSKIRYNRTVLVQIIPSYGVLIHRMYIDYDGLMKLYRFYSMEVGVTEAIYNSFQISDGTSGYYRLRATSTGHSFTNLSTDTSTDMRIYY